MLDVRKATGARTRSQKNPAVPHKVRLDIENIRTGYFFPPKASYVEKDRCSGGLFSEAG